MGAQQVLRATAGLLALCAVASGARADTRERVAIIDLGPNAADPKLRATLADDLTAAGLAPIADAAELDALAGVTRDPDQVALTAALDRAARAFGSLDCAQTTAAANDAIGLGAARQAAGLATPELARAWAYELLCADRGGDADAAMTAAARLRTLGAGSDAAIPPTLWTKYPNVDALSNRDIFQVEIRADVDGAAIWIDHARAGVSPLKTSLAAGAHVIAAATTDGRRGWAAGTAVRSQPVIAVVTRAEASPWHELAAKIASWHGEVPAAAELASVLTDTRARIAIIRHGDRVEAWGRIATSDAPHRLGGLGSPEADSAGAGQRGVDDAEAGVHALADAQAVAALAADRAKAWNDHAPDPDRPLLVDTTATRITAAGVDHKTKWWVYATIGGVVGALTLFVALHDHQGDTQQVELHYP